MRILHKLAQIVNEHIVLGPCVQMAESKNSRNFKFRVVGFYTIHGTVVCTSARHGYLRQPRVENLLPVARSSQLHACCCVLGLWSHMKGAQLPHMTDNRALDARPPAGKNAVRGQTYLESSFPRRGYIPQATQQTTSHRCGTGRQHELAPTMHRVSASRKPA